MCGFPAAGESGSEAPPRELSHGKEELGLDGCGRSGSDRGAGSALSATYRYNGILSAWEIAAGGS